MNKKTISGALSVLVYLLVFACAAFIQQTNTLEKISVGFRSAQTIKFKTNAFVGPEGIQHFRQLCEGSSANGFILFDDTQNNPYLKGIIIHGAVESPKIIEGRYFHEGDFFSEKKVAVIGENITSKTYILNNERYINLFDAHYKVIGICGYGLNCTMDNIVLYNMDSFQNYNYGLYAIDSSKQSSINALLKSVQNISEIEIIRDHPSGVMRALGYQKYFIPFLTALCLLLIFFFYQKFRSFFSCIQDLLISLRLLGFSWGNTFQLTFVRWLYYELCGLCIASLLYYFAVHILNSKSTIDIAVAFSVSLLSLLLFTSTLSYFWFKKGALKC